jgi:hypothetical protein
MAPPTASEQLIRDYLNRLSVAARDLAPDDRRALLERTRSLIDQKADLARRPSTMDVARVLSRLGDPARLVEQERRRLAAQGGSPRSATSAASATPARQRFLARALGREHGRLRGPSFGWQVQSASRGRAPAAPANGVANGISQPEAPAASDGQAAAAADAGPAAASETHARSSPSALAPPAPSPAPPATASADRTAGTNRPAGADGPLSASPPLSANGTANATAAGARAEAPRPERAAVAPQRASLDSGAGEQSAEAVPRTSGTGSDRRGTAPSAGAPAAGRAGSADQSATGADTVAAGAGPDAADAPAEGRRWRYSRAAVLRGPVHRQFSSLLAWARKRPLETVAIVLMGIGGPIFPPVFLIGATLALASELWDGRDKWVGLALPIVLTVIGLAVGVAAGGRAHWMHESWVYLDVVSRVAPGLGAGYLAWRCHRPRRPSSLPPFSRPYRTS